MPLRNQEKLTIAMISGHADSARKHAQVIQQIGSQLTQTTRHNWLQWTELPAIPQGGGDLRRQRQEYVRKHLPRLTGLVVVSLHEEEYGPRTTWAHAIDEPTLGLLEVCADMERPVGLYYTPTHSFITGAPRSVADRVARLDKLMTGREAGVVDLRADIAGVPGVALANVK